MAKKKQPIPQSKNTTIILLSLLALGLAVFSLCYYKNGGFSKETPKQYVQDTENDGIYTDTQYGFRFKYPKNVFKFVEPDGKVFYENKNDDPGTPLGWQGKGLKLNVSVVTDKNAFITFTEEENLKLNEPKYSDNYLDNLKTSKPYQNFTKLTQFNTNGVTGHLVYNFSTDKNEGIEPFYSYVSSWNDNKEIVIISITDFKDGSRKSEQLKLINGIINSMEFVAPSPAASN